jgi:hypothetical protein
VTPNQFRRIALSLPGASEGAHMGTADFRVGNRIFATLGNPDAASGVIGLTPDQQALLIETTPNVFVPVPGGWGARGWTRVHLAAADAAMLKSALTMAWRNRAPKKLVAGRARPAIKRKPRRTRSADQ